MRKIYFTLLLISGIILTSCDNKTSSLEFEKNVMYEVYPALMDSIWVNAVLTYSPPPPPPLENTPENRLQERKKTKKRFNQELAEFKKKKFQIDMVIFDTPFSSNNSEELQKHFKDAVVSQNSTLDTLEYRFDRKKLDAYKTFHLKYVSKIPKPGQRQLYENCCYSIRGMLVLSRIQFDTEKKYGVLSASIECGSMCGYGYLIYIKKENGKWIVDSIKDSWIA